MILPYENLPQHVKICETLHFRYVKIVFACLGGGWVLSWLLAVVTDSAAEEVRQMSGGGGYEVKISVLDDAQTAYHAQGSEVFGHRGQFESAANLPASAFGMLPQSASLAEQYSAFFEQVVHDMASLSQALTHGAKRLGVTAKNYRDAESANIIPY